MVKPKKLTVKQDAFVKAYIAGGEGIQGNATQSAIVAGYSKKTAAEQGCRLLKNVQIIELIAEHRESLSDRFEITVRGQVAKLELVILEASAAKQYSAVNGAIKAQSDLAGIEPPKKTDLNINGGVMLTLPGEMSRDEWEDNDE